MKRVICENAEGRRMTFSHALPFWLASIEGVRDIRHTVSSSKAAGQVGTTITGSAADERNIVIAVQIKGNFTQNRNTLLEFFQPNEVGTLYYYEDSIARKIEYVVESIESPETGIVRATTISLLCGDPLFRDIQETRVTLSSWIGLIRFPLYIHNPFAVTKKVNTLMEDIYNRSNTTLGLRIRFEASGEVKNPTIVDVQRHKILTVQLTMHAGEIVEITTGKLAKAATLIQGNDRTNVINNIAYPPQWPQLYKGDNLFRYNADSGIDALSVTIFYTQTYWGC